MAHVGSRIRTLPIGLVEGNFLIPAYQRGYRWTPAEVTRLLDDIVEHRQHRGPHDAYYLQPIVVTPRGLQSAARERDTEKDPRSESATQDNHRVWEVIDGQQRLTTVFLILKFLKQSTHMPGVAGPGFRLEYETRRELRGFLNDLEKISEVRNIDEEYVSKAYRAIEKWFEQNQNATSEVYEALRKQIKVIWYELPAASDPIAAFRRLNAGRIPLSDDELLKSLLLATIASTEDVSQTLCRQVASEWDVIERELRDPALWAFIAGQDNPPTRIGHLFSLMAELRNSGDEMLGAHPTFEILRVEVERDWRSFWKETQWLHGMLMGWFDHSELYHWMGFLRCCSTPVPWKDFLTTAREVCKSEFLRWVQDKVREKLDLTPSKLRDLRYGSNSKKIQDVLLLMNVEAARRSLYGKGRFPFELYIAGHWSLEHIHAQNSEDLRGHDAWRTWLEDHVRLLEMEAARLNGSGTDQTVLGETIETVRTMAKNEITGEDFDWASSVVLEQLCAHGLAGEDTVHSIDNLALLTRDINSALSNSVFGVKRHKLLLHDRDGTFIPVCTRHVFLKYYTRDEVAAQSYFWSDTDRADYLAAIEESLRDFLKENERGAE